MKSEIRPEIRYSTFLVREIHAEFLGVLFKELRKTLIEK
jgi:hypothetical protein